MTQIQMEDLDNYQVMYLKGSFNGADEENDALRSTFKKIAKPDKNKLLIDLSELNYLASSTLGALLSGNSLFKKVGGKVVMFNAIEYIENIFNITKLTLNVPYFKTKEEAIAELEKD
jgi:anti-anti-sigma factor